MEATMQEEFDKQKVRLEKHRVCDQCYCLGIQYNDCICSYGNYKVIELEFEVCICCGHLINDGQPADTEFNKQQLKQHE